MSRILEIHIPISPTSGFFNRVLLIAASLRHLGGVYADAQIVVSVGADEEPWDIGATLPWSQEFPVEWRWADRERFRRHSFCETGRNRFVCGFQARYVLLLDADTLIIRPIDDLLAEQERSSFVGGLIAHASPFRELRTRGQQGWWTFLYDEVGIGMPFFDHEHSGWGLFGEDAQYRLTPAYFNYGVVIAPATMMADLAEHIDPMESISEKWVGGRFHAQIGLSLALQRAHVPIRTLPFRFNCSNWNVFEQKYSGEIADVRIAHFHAGGVNRDTDFLNWETMRNLVNCQGLRGVNATIQQRIIALLPMIAHICQR